jgi:hypothetical protein
MFSGAGLKRDFHVSSGERCGCCAYLAKLEGSLKVAYAVMNAS